MYVCVCVSGVVTGIDKQRKYSYIRQAMCFKTKAITIIRKLY